MDECKQFLAVLYELSYFDKLEMFKQMNQMPCFKAHFFFPHICQIKRERDLKPFLFCMFVCVKWCETSLNSIESLLSAVGLFPNCIQNNFFR